VKVTDTLPSGVSYVSATASQGSCTQAGGVVTCELGSLPSGSDARVIIIVTVGSSTQGAITNTTGVTAATTDPTPGNNTDSEATQVNAQADLAVTKSDSSDPVVAGETLTYTLLVTNKGPSNATGVTVTDTLPSGVGYVSATASQGSCTQAGSVVTCELGTLASGTGATVIITVTVGSSTQETITNTAGVTGTTADSTPGNNTDSEATTVLNLPWLGDFVWLDTDGDGVQDAGETIGIANVPISVTNSAGTVITVAHTNLGGCYKVEHLQPDTYTVTVGSPPNPHYILTSDSPLTTTLVGGSYDDAMDFGFISPTGLKVQDFRVTATEEGVVIEWLMADEEGLEGFNLWRDTNSVAPEMKINPELILPHGPGQPYTYQDTDVVPRLTYYYWLQGVPDGGEGGEFYGPRDVTYGGKTKYLVFLPMIVR